MKIKLLTTLAAFALAAGAAGAVEAAVFTADDHSATERPAGNWGPGRRGARGPGMLGLAAEDAEADVSRTDFIAFIGSEFDFRDRNGDGVLTIEDASPAERARIERMRNSPRAQAWRERQGEDAAGPREMTRDAFIERSLSLFDRVDSNSDGVVTAEERTAAAEQMRERMRERRGNGERRGRGHRRGG
ncbi:hypothetical protein L2D01_07020 [Hyphomonadaceae bacterium ML37]|nr:hypothetical protein L2D01_07020 [Hyphomonadaceae bacterium ML37]